MSAAREEIDVDLIAGGRVDWPWPRWEWMSILYDFRSGESEISKGMRYSHIERLVRSEFANAIQGAVGSDTVMVTA